MFRIALILLFFSVPILADTLTVGQGQEFPGISQALQRSAGSDVILVFPGTYKEGLIEIDKPVSLFGVSYPVVEGSDQNGVFLVTSDDVVVSGFQIQNVGTSYLEDRAGIRLDNVKNCMITNNKLLNNFFGIYLQKASKCVVRDNEVIGEATLEMSSGNAIHLWYCKEITIQNNTAANHRDGIYLEFVDGSVISGNTSINNLRYGLHFMFSNNDQYHNNRFESNGAGVAVMFSKHIRMIDNLFLNNWGTASYGLLLKEIYDGEISGNLFAHNTIGIYGESANRLMIKDNDLKRNGWALKIMGSCMDNTFTGNNFFTNTFDLTTNSREDYNTYSGNYWSDYTGYDLDRNGYGDIPHRPVNLYSYLVGKVDVSILLLRSLFIDILNFAEKVTPLFVPQSLVDPKPLMRPRV